MGVCVAVQVRWVDAIWLRRGRIGRSGRARPASDDETRRPRPPHGCAAAPRSPRPRPSSFNNAAAAAAAAGAAAAAAAAAQAEEARRTSPPPPPLQLIRPRLRRCNSLTAAAIAAARRRRPMSDMRSRIASALSFSSSATLRSTSRCRAKSCRSVATAG